MADEEDREENKSSSPCSGLRYELLKCLKESDCVKKEGKTPRECLKENTGHDCNPLRVAFFECKRSALDNRQRFRGRKGY
jgi:cytochrome c oxidase assembly factor 5